MFKAKRWLPLTEYGWEVIETVALLIGIACLAVIL
jgi:hypothetical protein